HGGRGRFWIIRVPIASEKIVNRVRAKQIVQGAQITSSAEVSSETCEDRNLYGGVLIERQEAIRQLISEFGGEEIERPFALDRHRRSSVPHIAANGHTGS